MIIQQQQATANCFFWSPFMSTDDPAVFPILIIVSFLIYQLLSWHILSSIIIIVILPLKRVSSSSSDGMKGKSLLILDPPEPIPLPDDRSSLYQKKCDHVMLYSCLLSKSINFVTVISYIHPHLICIKSKTDSFIVHLTALKKMLLWSRILLNTDHFCI